MIGFMPAGRGQLAAPSRLGRRLLLAGMLLAGACGAAHAADPDFGAGKMVFRSSSKSGCGKIPAIAGDGAGVLVAAVEQRFGAQRYLEFETLAMDPDDGRDVARDRFGCGDYGFANIIYRRSTDDGKSWDEVKLLADLRRFKIEPTDSVFVGNPTLTWVPRKKRFVALFVVSRSKGKDNSASCVMAQLRPMPKCKTEPASLDAYAIHSDDLGVTWSEPKKIDRPEGVPPLFRPGPGHGSVLPSGRIVVPAYPRLMLSDDDGETWRFGADNRRPKLAGSETSLAPLADGQVWSLLRLSTRDLKRLTAENGTPLWLSSGLSRDGGESYASIEPTRRFPIPVVHSSLLAATLKDGKPVVVLSGPTVRDAPETVSLHGDRRDMMVAVGDGPKGGRFRAAIVHQGPAGYSDLVALGPGRVGILYEGTDADDPVLKDRSYVRKTLFKEIDLEQVLACAKADDTADSPAGENPAAAEPTECFGF